MSAKCCICTDEFSGIDDLEAHISADHYNCLPFECEKCKFAKFPTEFAIKRHYEEDHGLVEYFIRYRVSREIYEKKQKIRECLERCIRVSDSAGQLGLASRNIVGDYISSITTQQSSTASNHYQNRQMHENEFLSLSSSKIRGTNLSDIFQQQHGGPMLSNSTGDRHQHHSEFSNTGPASDAGYETLNGANLIGNLLEHMKPDLDSTNLSNFDQLYSPDISTANDEQRGIDKFVPNPTQQTSQDLLFLNQKQTNVSATKKTTSVPSTSSNISTNWTSNVIRPTPPELRCQACSCMVVSRSTSLMYHVNVKHLKLAMFKCRECGEEFLWNKSAAIRHAQRHGGDENMIENNSERHFPTLNRHKREYFNLGRCTSNSTCEDSSSQYLEDAQATEIIEKHAKLELKTPEIVLTVKDEKEDDSISAADKSNIGKAVNVVEVKNEQTPNSILAQLVDISRGKKNEVERGSDTIVCNNIQRRSTARERMTTAKGANAKTSIPTQSSTVSSHMVANTSTNISSYNITNTDEQKVHKSIQCDGCGDMVVNQEWIMLNHVNTKHLHLPLYKCVSCNKPFENYLRSYAVRHTKFYHAGDENLLVDQREMFWNDLREACSNLFKSGGR